MHLQLLGEPRALGEAGLLQPLHHRARALAERVLLQRLQGGEPTAQGLLALAGGVQGVRRLPLTVPGPLELLAAGGQGPLQLHAAPLALLELRPLADRVPLQGLSRQLRLLATQTVQALLELSHGLNQVLDARGFRVPHAGGLGGLLAYRRRR